MGKQAAGVLFVLVLVGVVVGVDVLFFRGRFWERLMVNVGIVLGLREAFGLPTARPLPLVRRASHLIYAEHFQPVGVLLGFVSDQVGCLYHPLWLVPIGEIDDPRALGAEHV